MLVLILLLLLVSSNASSSTISSNPHHEDDQPAILLISPTTNDHQTNTTATTATSAIQQSNQDDGKTIPLAIAPKFPALLSIICSIMIIRRVIRSPSRRKDIYHRLICGLSFSDVISSSAYFLGTWLIPFRQIGGFGEVYGAIGNHATCSLSGFLTQMAIASPLYNFSLSLYYLLTINYNWSEYRIRNIEKWFHVLPLGYALLSSSIALALDMYGNVEWLCWIKPDVPDGTPPTDAQKNFVYFQWIFLFGPLWLTILFVSLVFYVLYRKVRENEKKMEKYNFSSQCNNSNSNSNIKLQLQAAVNLHDQGYHHESRRIMAAEEEKGGSDPSPAGDISPTKKYHHHHNTSGIDDGWKALRKSKISVMAKPHPSRHDGNYVADDDLGALAQADRHSSAGEVEEGRGDEHSMGSINGPIKYQQSCNLQHPGTRENDCRHSSSMTSHGIPTSTMDSTNKEHDRHNDITTRDRTSFLLPPSAAHEKINMQLEDQQLEQEENTKLTLDEEMAITQAASASIRSIDKKLFGKDTTTLYGEETEAEEQEQEDMYSTDIVGKRKSVTFSSTVVENNNDALDPLVKEEISSKSSNKYSLSSSTKSDEHPHQHHHQDAKPSSRGSWIRSSFQSQNSFPSDRSSQSSIMGLSKAALKKKNGCYERALRSRQIAVQGILYSCAFYFTWLFPTIQRITELAVKRNYYVIQFLDSFLLPLQGAFNFAIYIRPRYIAFKNKNPDAGFWRVLWEVTCDNSSDV